MELQGSTVPSAAEPHLVYYCWREALCWTVYGPIGKPSEDRVYVAGKIRSQVESVLT